MFAFLSATYNVPTTDFEKDFFDNIKKFAFKKELCDKCKANDDHCITKLMDEGKYKNIVANAKNKIQANLFDKVIYEDFYVLLRNRAF